MARSMPEFVEVPLDDWRKTIRERDEAVAALAERLTREEVFRVANALQSNKHDSLAGCIDAVLARRSGKEGQTT